MKVCYNSKTNGGGSLVELVISTAIIAIVAAGIMGCFTFGFFTLRLARENQRATQIILEKVETIRLYTWDQVNSNGFIPVAFTDYYDPQARSGSRGVAYSGLLAITNVPFSTSYSTNLRQLTVTLSWNTAGTLPHRRTLCTLVAKDGLQNYVY